MSGNIASLISDFSSPASSEGLGLAILRRVRQVSEAETVHVQAPVDRQAELVETAVAQARAEEREAARRKLEEALNRERERQRDELSMQRELWAETEALQLSAQIVKAVGHLEAAISDRVARILATVIPEALRQNAIAEFREVLGTILSGEVTTLLRVTGPEDLLKILKSGMALREGLVEFVPSDDVEVTLVAGDTTVQTQLGSWAMRLQAALKAE